MNQATFGSNIDDVAGLPNMEPAVVRDAPARAPVKAAPKPARIRIILEEHLDIPPTGLFISVNGDACMIKPGRAADVLPQYVEVLNNAIMATPIVDEDTKRVVGFRDKLRFPYRLVAHIPAEA